MPNELLSAKYENEEYRSRGQNQKWSTMDLKAFSDRDQKDVENLLQLVEFNKDIQFIVDHSLYDPDLLKSIVKYKKSRPLLNLWLDASNLFFNSDVTQEDKTKIVTLWRAFGFNKILFGSDITFGGRNWDEKFEKTLIFKEALLKNILSLQESSLITADEKNLLFVENGKILLKRIGITSN